MNVSGRLIVIVNCIPRDYGVPRADLTLRNPDLFRFLHRIKLGACSHYVIAGVRVYYPRESHCLISGCSYRLLVLAGK
jgi:hypothetical protein